MKIGIIVGLQVEGVHCWPNCPLEQVSFLRTPHRHIFHIEAKKEVKHDDRDVEIIDFKRSIKHYLETRYVRDYPGVCEFGSMSCEMIARELTEVFELYYCSVLEDNENGAEVLNG